MGKRTDSLRAAIAGKVKVAGESATTPPIPDAIPVPPLMMMPLDKSIVEACKQSVKPAPKPPRKPKPPSINRGGPHARDLAQQNLGRLPNGAHFTVIYSAKDVKWTGMLAIPDVRTFTAEASGVFKLLAKLDSLWRDWMRANGAATSSGASDAATPAASASDA
jgi:hypothetical protein